MRKLRAVTVFGVLGLTLACGGGSGGSGGGGGGGGGIAGCTNGTSASAGGNAIAVSAANVTPITVDGGLPASGTTYVNGVFVTVTVCVHGTTTCQNIDHVLVDTGSYGLRLLSKNGGGALNVQLPLEPDPNVPSNTVTECAQFSDGITWGPVGMADILISGESATSVPQNGGSAGMPLQIIGDSRFPTVPSSCTSNGAPEDTLQQLLANGIVGVGPFPSDCSGCDQPPATGKNPGLYYSCPSGGCNANSQPAAEPLAAQVWNPVAAFTAISPSTTADNNGVIVELQSVPASGLAVAQGKLVFGIGTQNNNGLGSTAVYTGDLSASITTMFAGQTFSNSFIDSGSNGYFFNFPSGTNVATCPGNTFYCPVSGGQAINLACSATNVGTNGKQASINFNVANLSASSNNAFNNLGGTNTPPPGSAGPTGFDWGLPFFYGRNVYTGMAAVPGVTSTPPGVPPGPFYAY